jgi:hypothetical protein
MEGQYTSFLLAVTGFAREISITILSNGRTSAGADRRDEICRISSLFVSGNERRKPLGLSWVTARL